MAKGDIYRCPKCGNTIREADCEYTAVVCTWTRACREKGGTVMVKDSKF